MKKLGILNREISSVLSHMGHTDTLCISDCGLPIPNGVPCIDLSLRFGVPSFKEVLDVVLEDMKIEKIVLAREIMKDNPEVFTQINEHLAGLGVEIEFVPHTLFKEQTTCCKAIIRTGETSPFANIILQSGCIFA